MSPVGDVSRWGGQAHDPELTRPAPLHMTRRRTTESQGRGLRGLLQTVPGCLLLLLPQVDIAPPEEKDRDWTGVFDSPGHDNRCARLAQLVG